MRPYKLDLWGPNTAKWLDLDHVLIMTLNGAQVPPQYDALGPEDPANERWYASAHIHIVFAFRDEPVIYRMETTEVTKAEAELALARFQAAFEDMCKQWSLPSQRV